MGSFAMIGDEMAFAVNDTNTTFPLGVLLKDGAFSTVFNPGAGTAINVFATPGNFIFYGAFGVNYNVVRYVRSTDTITDISIPGIGNNAVNALIRNNTDGGLYAIVDTSQALYHFASGVWSIVNATLGIDGTDILGSFAEVDKLYLAGKGAVNGELLFSPDEGVTIQDVTGGITGASVMAASVVVNVN